MARPCQPANHPCLVLPTPTALERKTSQDDTHPAPAERFRLAQRVKSRDEMPADGTVWELFADREAITREMSQLVERNIQTD